MSERSKRDRIAVDLKGDWQRIVYIMPPGHQAVGVVRQGSASPGVLARIESSGDYVQLNAQGTRTLDQRKVRAAVEAQIDAIEDIDEQRRIRALAGIPNPRGRPRMSYEKRETYSMKLEPSLAEYLREVGGGNLSAGITLVATEHRERKINAQGAINPRTG